MTKQEAIKNHRAMWNWIADQIEERKQALNIGVLKYRYLHHVYNGYASHNCFCCEYDDEHDDHVCSHCPLVWPEGHCIVLYKVCCESHDYNEQAKYARKIANLPERKGV